jgi:histidine ammonia-lyase
VEPLIIRTPDDLDLEAVEQVALDGRRLAPIDAALLEELDVTHHRLLARLGSEPVYGVNTGTGYLQDIRLNEKEQQGHQRNLLLARAVGGEPYLDRGEARALVTARLAGFLRGHAGVTPELCTFLVDRLNDDFVPAIPRTMIGCAGEVIPLAHAFQTFIGVGSVISESGSMEDAALALAQRHVAPYQIAAKEGIALLAGAPGTSGLAVVRRRESKLVARQLLVVFACAIDALHAPLSAYSAPVGQLANDPQMEQVLRDLRILLAGSRQDPERVQAPVSFRVVPQVLTHVERTVGRLEEDVRRALGASDDSPAFVGDEFVTSGNFHAIGLAAAMDATSLALVQAAELAAQHIHRLLDHRFSGLPDQLTLRPGPQTGLTVVHKRAVGAASELRRLAMPASVGLVDTSLGQEDAMTFAFEAAEKLRRVHALVRDVMACELLTVYQAWSLGAGPAAGLAEHFDILRRAVAPIEVDRPLGGDIAALIGLLDRGAFSNVSR